MKNKEILANLKKSYNYLTDIRENGYLKENTHKLDYTIDYIKELYHNFYNTLDKEELRVGKIERQLYECKVYISNYVSSDYLIDSKIYDEECGGISYMTCCDLDYCWYEDKDFMEIEEEY